MKTQNIPFEYEIKNQEKLKQNIFKYITSHFSLVQSKIVFPFNSLYNDIQKQNRACFNQNINNKSVTWGKMLIIFDSRNIHYHLFYIFYVHTFRTCLTSKTKQKVVFTLFKDSIVIPMSPVTSPWLRLFLKTF